MTSKNSSSNKVLGYTNRLLIGFIVSLSFTLMAFEYTSVKSYEIPEYDTLSLGEDDLILPPITYRMDKIEKPEPETKTTTEMTIVENIETIENKIEIEVEPIDDPIDVTVIDGTKLMGEEIIIEDEPPRSSAEVYAGYGNCEGLTDSESYLCATKEIIRRIQENFEIPEGLKSTSGDYNSYVQFVVDKKGNVTNVKSVRSNHPLMGDASENAVKKLPKMNPATQRGMPVKLIMTVPITLNMAP